MSNYHERAPYKERRCPCGVLVASHAYARHRRSDACVARPSPVPRPCKLHSRRWPCVSCDCVRYSAAGVSVELTAAALGVSVEFVERELRFDRARRAPLTDERLLEFIGVFRAALGRRT